MSPTRALLLMAAFLLGVSSLAAQIGARIQKQGSIHGVWHNTQFGFQMTLVLNPDGTGEFDGEPMRFTAQGERLSITEDGETTAYTFKLQSDSLTLAGGDLDAPIKFTRASSPAATEPGASATPPQHAGAESLEAPASGGATDPLLGTWSGHGETIEFSANGQCRYLGQTYPYELAPGHVILNTPQGAIMLGYRVSGETLTLAVNGQKLSYTRGGGAAIVSGNQPAGRAGGGGGSHAVPRELVGKWCFINVTTTNTGGVTSDECITLNADGTYEYYSERSMSANTDAFYAGTSSQSGDRGRWWVEGDRVFYDSPTRGQGSYQLQKVNHPKNGDAMIVLDGSAYVTAYQRPSW